MATKHKAFITGVDRLLDLVNEKHEVSITDASKQLNVQTQLMEHWVDVLEAEGLLCSKLTLNERYIVSLEFNKNNSGIVHSIFKNIKSLVANTKNPESTQIKNKMQEILEKEREIDGKIKILNQRMRHLKGYEAMKAKTEEKMKKFSKLQEELFNLKMHLEKENELLAHSKKKFNEHKSFFSIQLSIVAQQLREYGLHKKVLSEKESQMDESILQFESQIRTFDKEKTDFEKKLDQLELKKNRFLEKIKEINLPDLD